MHTAHTLTATPRHTLVSEIIPSGKGCGAEVRGIDLARLDGNAVDVLKQALLEHLVVVVRGQPISDPQLIALGKSFGELEPPGMSIIGKPYIDAYPDILVISNILARGRPYGTPTCLTGRSPFHTQSCMLWKFRRPGETLTLPTSIWPMRRFQRN
jgi:alpha-ketoglutarate-dependent taurine dioxygenase